MSFKKNIFTKIPIKFKKNTILSYLDLSIVSIFEFSLLYINLVFFYLAVSVSMEASFFHDNVLAISAGLVCTFVLSFVFLIFRMLLMKAKIRAALNWQIFFSFLSFPINLLFLFWLTDFFEKILPFFGFLIAYNLHILNIAFITKCLNKNHV